MIHSGQFHPNSFVCYSAWICLYVFFYIYIYTYVCICSLLLNINKLLLKVNSYLVVLFSVVCEIIFMQWRMVGARNWKKRLKGCETFGKKCKSWGGNYIGDKCMKEFETTWRCVNVRKKKAGDVEIEGN